MVSGQEANTFFSKAIKEGNSLSTEHKNIKYENKFKEKLKQELIEIVKKKEIANLRQLFNKLRLN